MGLRHGLNYVCLLRALSCLSYKMPRFEISVAVPQAVAVARAVAVPRAVSSSGKFYIAFTEIQLLLHDESPLQT